MTDKKRILISIFCLLLVIFGLSNFIFQVSGETINGFSTNYNQSANQGKNYYFNNSIRFGIFTNVSLNGSIEFDKQISNRKTFIIVKNDNPITMDFNSKTNMKGYGMQNQPKGPSSGNYQFKYQFNYILKLQSNSTVQNITIQYLKVNRYGLNPNENYQIAVFQDGEESWELVSTYERINETSGETYLEAELLDLNANEEYYITLFQITPISYDWIWIVVIIGVIAIVGLVIMLSKKDYFQFLKTRTIPVDKGVHQLSMEEVLENENRNKIIDLILTDPGIHFNELLRETELSAGNLAWHLDILETYKVIGKKRIGRYLVYFPYYQKNPISNIDLKLQKSELTLKVLEMIEEKPGTYNNEIAQTLHVDHKTVAYHINKLKDLGLIHSEKSGRKKKLYPNLEAEYYTNNKQ